MSKQTIFGILAASLLLTAFLFFIFIIYDSVMASLIGNAGSRTFGSIMAGLTEKVKDGFANSLKVDSAIMLVVLVLAIILIVIPIIKGKEDKSFEEEDIDSSKK